MAAIEYAERPSPGALPRSHPNAAPLPNRKGATTIGDKDWVAEEEALLAQLQGAAPAPCTRGGVGKGAWSGKPASLFADEDEEDEEGVDVDDASSDELVAFATRLDDECFDADLSSALENSSCGTAPTGALACHGEAKHLVRTPSGKGALINTDARGGEESEEQSEEGEEGEEGGESDDDETGTDTYVAAAAFEELQALAGGTAEVLRHVENNVNKNQGMFAQVLDCMQKYSKQFNDLQARQASMQEENRQLREMVLQQQQRERESERERERESATLAEATHAGVAPKPPAQPELAKPVPGDPDPRPMTEQEMADLVARMQEHWRAICCSRRTAVQYCEVLKLHKSLYQPFLLRQLHVNIRALDPERMWTLQFLLDGISYDTLRPRGVTKRVSVADRVDLELSHSARKLCAPADKLPIDAEPPSDSTFADEPPAAPPAPAAAPKAPAKPNAPRRRKKRADHGDSRPQTKSPCMREPPPALSDTPISPTLLTGNGGLLDAAVSAIAATSTASTPLPGDLECPFPLLAHNSKGATEQIFGRHGAQDWDAVLREVTHML
jgi:hypothetical protein